MAHARRSKVKDPAKAFISTWRTSTVYTGSTADNQIKLPLEVAGTYKFTVNWGDGSSNVITTWNQAETIHTYATPGDYTVTITGYIKGWDFGGGGGAAPTTGDMRKLLTITQFGCLRLVTHATSLAFWGTLYGCTNLTLTGVQDMPNFKGTTSNMGFLRGCTALTTINNINKWDVSKITFSRNLFRECTLFNDNVGNWNMSNNTHIAAMFHGNLSGPTYGLFNNGGSDSIRYWDTRNVTDMSALFNFQPKFDQPVGDWNISNVTNMQFIFNGINVAPYSIFNNGGSDSIKNWNTSNATTMLQLFTAQPLFNQPISNWNTSKVIDMRFLFYAFVSGASIFNQNLSNWDTSKVTAMQEMFRYTDNFNQPIGNWNVSLVTNFSNFMLGKTNLNYSAANYDALLIGWASRPVKPNLSINFGTIKYTAAASAARAILTSAPNNWTIVDGGLVV